MSGKIIKNGIWILFLALVTTTAVHAGTYKWVDKDGNVVYSQHPPPDGKYEALKVKPAPRRPSSSSSVSERNKKFLNEASKQRGDKAKLQAEQQKNMEIRKKNCDIAKKQLEYFMVQRRKKTEQGEYVNISDSERKSKIAEAKQGIKDYCD